MLLSHRYNNKTYRVDDIDWDQNPNSTFKKADGSEVSFLEYYRKVRRAASGAFALVWSAWAGGEKSGRS